MKLLRNLLLISLALVLLPTVVLAQVTTATMASSSTIAPSVEELLDGGLHVYGLAKSGAIIVLLIAVINMLVNVSKFKPINEFIKRKKLKWLRPLMALAVGFLTGLATGITQGMEWYMATLYAFGGLFTGGMAVVMHEVYAGIKGDRA